MTFDPDLGKVGFARTLFRLRWRRLRISQAQFAARFGLSVGSIKDLEQGRTRPTRAVRLLIAAIASDPGLIAKVAASVRPELEAAERASRRRRIGKADHRQKLDPIKREMQDRASAISTHDKKASAGADA